MDNFMNHLFEKEENILNIHKEINELEIANQQMKDSNHDSLNLLEKQLTNIKKLLATDESSINQSERIKELYKKKEDLFVKLIKSAKFYEAKDDNKRTIDDVEENEQSKWCSKRSKLMLKELEQCEVEMESCFEIMNQFESKFRTE